MYILVLDGEPLITPGTIHGIMVAGIAPGIHLGIMVGTAHGTIADGILRGITVDGMIHGITVDTGAADIITGFMMDIIVA